MTLVIYTYLALVGLALGSFVNALVYRLNMQLDHPKAKKNNRYSITHGRSICTTCKHRLAAKDLVPLLSWIVLRGKCRYCKTPISAQYPVVELATALLVIISALFWPYGTAGWGLAKFCIWLGIVTVSVALALYDIKWMILPNKLVYSLGLFVLTWTLIEAAEQQLFSAIWQPLLGALLLGGFFHIIFVISNGKWIGGGDVRLGYVLGLLAGTPFLSVMLLFSASLAGLTFILAASSRGSKIKDNKIPFGPFLLIGAMLIVVFGSLISALLDSILIVGY
jgi:leader peptidase (prepilin peptidase)/N-methyltransferase